MSKEASEGFEAGIPVKKFMAIQDLVIPRGDDLIRGIRALKEERNAVVLAHYCQSGVVRELVDFEGGSLQLARWVKETQADMIVFFDFHFMAEVAKILQPSKKVVFPDLETEGFGADEASGDELRKAMAEYPDALVVASISCDTERKAAADVVVTGANAEAIIRILPKERPIIFVSDKNWGRDLMEKTGRAMVLLEHCCVKRKRVDSERFNSVFEGGENHRETEVVERLEQLYLCMKYGFPEVVVEESLRLKALKPIEKMLELSEALR